MPNEILKILLKSMKKRSIAELALIIKFYQTATQQEMKYAWHLDNKLNENN